jgi:aspartate racemase
VLGLGEPTIYTAPLRELGITCEIVSPELRSKLDDGIASLMEGAESDDSRAAARDAVEELRSRNVQGVVLGCTEIPLLLAPGASDAPDLINPLELLARAAVRHAMG